MTTINKRDQLPSLLLLPFPPHPSNRTLLDAAYRPPLTAVLSKLKHANPHGASKLIIAVAVPILQGPPYQLRSKTLLWSQAQALIAGLYAIISVICARLKISTEIDGGPGSVDATVVLVDHDRGRKPLSAEDRALRGDSKSSNSLIETNNTVVVDLATFADAYHPWNYIFHVRTEQGIRLNEVYLQMAEGKMIGAHALRQEQLVGVEGGLTLHHGLVGDDTTAGAGAAGGAGNGEGRRVSGVPVVCLGGTFDYLHPGHKLLLTAGALLLGVPSKDELSLPATSPRRREPCKYIIGITGDELLKNKKFAEYVQSWETRARNVIYFLSRLLQLSDKGWREAMGPAAGDNIHSAAAAGVQIDEKDGDFRAAFRDGTIIVQCVRIQDAFGPTVTEENIDVLVVSGETRSGGKAVNDKRAEQGWKTLEVFEVDVLNADEIPEDVGEDVKATEDFTSKISSTVIRQQRAAQATGKSEPKI
ncbi:hypothetical protein GE21DRAFT_10201 [Neurospora crassa]|uniref:Pantetheine-phosphate adenylyltransferase family protein n=1 Tax=Neurospora crassa (strain ATCC 24698 / 74-OR23-1A / CBS 708.71 / DSM 1257 / FGSC 987) TaxID=367110 RepID=Q7S4F6_NEUCR|nr:hypothetical protein NCU06029 [Neurospora crassa OR74A]EAA30383.1 hypothetical protein NCU06029 [Neurospora crassa OR74A]KHE84571.1 hypothetical protein GE21DRAFT_10201 [Neurospora crassa]|eukprot:XP_959619.1 hypothetical protein NCU06029 [Neurospora crassa OR74A]